MRKNDNELEVTYLITFCKRRSQAENQIECSFMYKYNVYRFTYICGRIWRSCKSVGYQQKLIVDGRGPRQLFRIRKTKKLNSL